MNNKSSKLVEAKYLYQFEVAEAIVQIILLNMERAKEVWILSNDELDLWGMAPQRYGS